MKLRALTATAALRVTTGQVQGVWSVRMPLWPWRFRAAESEREEILLELFGIFPGGWLWTPDDSAAQEWRAVSSNDVVWVNRDLSAGGWAIVFPDSQAEAPPLTSLPSRPEGVRRLLEAISAAAMVISEPDDTEWTVALREAD